MGAPFLHPRDQISRRTGSSMGPAHTFVVLCDNFRPAIDKPGGNIVNCHQGVRSALSKPRTRHPTIFSIKNEKGDQNMKRESSMKRPALTAASCLLSILLLACSGCQKASEDWDASIDITDAFNEGLKDALDDNEELLELIDLDDLIIEVTASAQEDGSYKLTVDERALERTVSDAVTSILDGMEEYEASKVDPLVGDWARTEDGTDDFIQGMQLGAGDNSEMLEYFDFDRVEFIVQYTLSFREDGTYELSVDEDAYERAIDNVLEVCRDWFYDYFADAIQKEGLDMTVDEYLESVGYTMDSLMEESFDKDDLMSTKDQMEQSGTYQADDGSLLLVSGGGEEELSYTLNGKKLTLTGSDDGSISGTVTFTKK